MFHHPLSETFQHNKQNTCEHPGDCKTLTKPLSGTLQPLKHANTIIEHRALDSFGILFSAWKLQKYLIIQQTYVELSLCYYSIRKPIRDQVFSKVVVFPSYGMDGLDHGGTDYFFSQHVSFSTFKGNFQSHLFQKNRVLLFFIVRKADI
jgi:hypothetical protein